jgi:hypothetical protein
MLDEAVPLIRDHAAPVSISAPDGAEAQATRLEPAGLVA